MGPVSGRGGNGRRAPMADINVTPLVDVMLVLLIIFMITAPLLVSGVPVNLPDARAAPLEADQKPLSVSMDAAGKIFVNDEETAEAALPDRLAALKAGNSADQQVFLRADRGLEYGRVMRVMGELNRAGLNKVALVSVGEDAR